MRNAFVRALVEHAEDDPSIMLLTGDLGFMALEPFADRFPSRFFNCGVAEQNMVGVATGLAEAGFRPFVYSIATFASMRPFEFIRNGPLLHSLPVCIVGIGGGMDYGLNGASHYAVEDIALMRAHPEMAVIVPADAAQTPAAVATALSLESPSYLRLEKSRPSGPELSAPFELGRATRVGDGQDVALVAMGGLTHEAIGARELLRRNGIAARVVVVPGFNPSPTDDIVDMLADVPLALAAEAHVVHGGLGSFVCEAVAGAGLRTKVVRCGLHEIPRNEVGSRDFLLERHGLSAAELAATALRAMAVAP